MHDTPLPQARQTPTLSARVPLDAARGDPNTPHHLPRHPGSGAGPGSLYIHVPFCFHKCHYCDFYSFVDTRDRQPAFVERLARELAALARHAGPIRTVFVGGGTPSLLSPALWRRLLSALRDHFDLSPLAGPEGEFTVECNPETVTPELMGVLRDGGVDRVSIGAQSFHPAHLKTLERWHDPDNVPRAVELARAAGIARQSLDLIAAIPGQTLGDLDDDLSRALDTGVTHLSCYTLTYEPNTAMTARLRRAEFEPASEDLELEMFQRVAERLGRAGLERYEVSNFARPGHESRHNLAYWRQDAWLAAGPSASAHVGGRRWKNVPRLDDYLSFDDDGYAPITDLEAPDPRRALTELLMTSLRLREGADARRVREAALAIAPDVAPSLERVAQGLAGRGLLVDRAGRWVLTDAGLVVENRVTLEFMDALA